MNTAGLIPRRWFMQERPTETPVRSSGSAARGGGFLEFFVIAQIMLPALLYLPGTQPLRVPIRVAPFALSLIGFIVWQALPHKRVRWHPAAPLLAFVLVYLAGMVGMPTTNTLLAG